MSVKILTVKEDILSANDENAKANRELVDKHHVLMINVMSSPGAGKTSLIMQTINRFKGKTRIAVMEGDIASTIDADKISKLGIPAVQINTAGGCHLDANMIRKALDNLAWRRSTSSYRKRRQPYLHGRVALGAHKEVMLLSVPEGDDKPHKYPLMFTEAEWCW